MTFRIFLLLLAGIFVGFFANSAEARKVDLALVLLIDDSGSIDQNEARMQRSGYAAAFRSGPVVEAMTRGPNQAIAVSVVLFTDQVRVMIPWTVIDGKNSAEALASRIQGIPRMPGAATHIGKGLEFSINHISRCPHEFFASTIDLSADGWDNQYAPAVDGAALITGLLGAVTGIQIGIPQGPDPVGARKLSQLRDYAKSRGITINCIAIEDASLRDYFSRHVMTGPNAFTLFAPSFRAFTDAIHRKLLREINEGVKLSAVRQKKALPASAEKKPSQPGKARETQKPARAAGATGEARVAGREAEPGAVEQEAPPPAVVEVAPPVERRYQILVRDAANDFPVDEVRVEALSPAESIGIDAPEGRPGLIVVDLRAPAGQIPRVRLSAPLFLPREVALNDEITEVRLERMPLRVVW